MNQPQKAFEYCQRSLALLKGIPQAGDCYSLVYNNNMGAIYSMLGNYNKAKIAFDSSIFYAVKIGSRTFEMENYLNLSEMYGKMNQYQLESEFLKKYYTIKDSVISNDSKIKMSELEPDYYLEKKKKNY